MRLINKVFSDATRSTHRQMKAQDLYRPSGLETEWELAITALVDVLRMNISKRRKSLHDYIGGTAVIEVQSK